MKVFLCRGDVNGGRFRCDLGRCSGRAVEKRAYIVDTQRRNVVGLRRNLCIVALMREGQQPYILQPFSRMGKHNCLHSSSLDDGMLRRQVAHRLLFLVPWAARLAPTGTVKQANFDAFTRCRFHGCVHNVVPFGRLNSHRTAWRLVVSYALVADKRTVYAGFLHGFQVVDNAFPADIARNPIPVT